MPNKKQVEVNLAHVDYAIGQQRLEGLEVSDAAIEDLKKVAKGDMTTEECRQRILDRYVNVDKICK